MVKKTWNAIANIQCRTRTVTDHFGKETSIHQETVRASMRQKISYFHREENNQVMETSKTCISNCATPYIGLLKKKCHHRKLHLF